VYRVIDPELYDELDKEIVRTFHVKTPKDLKKSIMAIAIFKYENGNLQVSVGSKNSNLIFESFDIPNLHFKFTQ
jgi:hypothetical protein